MELPLTSEDVGPRRTEIALSTIAGVMLWPGNPEKRDQLDKTTNANLARQMIKEDLRAGDFSNASNWGSWIDIIAEATPVEAMKACMARRYRDGHAVGMVTLQATVESVINEIPPQLASFKKSASAISSRVGDMLGVGPVNDDTLEKAWAEHQGTRHLWGAAIWESLLDEPPDFLEALKQPHPFPSISLHRPFPSRLERLPTFLFLAHLIGTYGGSVGLPRSKHVLIPAPGIWQIPAEVVEACTSQLVGDLYKSM